MDLILLLNNLLPSHQELPTKRIKSQAPEPEPYAPTFLKQQQQSTKRRPVKKRQTATKAKTSSQPEPPPVASTSTQPEPPAKRKRTQTLKALINMAQQ